MNKTTNHLNLIDIYRTLYPTTAKDTFFSSSHETFTKAHPKLTSKRNLTISEDFSLTEYVIWLEQRQIINY